MKLPIILISGLICVACAAGYNPSYRFSEVQVINLSGAKIADISVSVIDTPKILNCSEVARNAICNDRFGQRRYPRQGIELSWTHGDGSRKSEILNPHVPAYLPPVYPLRIMLEIGEDGSVKSFYRQDERYLKGM